MNDPFTGDSRISEENPAGLPHRVWAVWGRSVVVSEDPPISDQGLEGVFLREDFARLQAAYLLAGRMEPRCSYENPDSMDFFIETFRQEAREP